MRANDDPIIMFEPKSIKHTLTVLTDGLRVDDLLGKRSKTCANGVYEYRAKGTSYKYHVKDVAGKREFSRVEDQEVDIDEGENDESDGDTSRFDDIYDGNSIDNLDELPPADT